MFSVCRERAHLSFLHDLLQPISLTPCFSWVNSRWWVHRTALAVYPAWQTAKAVESFRRRHPQLKLGVNEQRWYVTGDIAAIDEDGFLQITDRLSRFSKIGGEMVPHIKVEEKLHELAGVTEQTFVVASVSDEKKGERLVVLHKLSEDKLQACFEKLAHSDLPNLWKPRADSFIRIENFPMLGTGKLDLQKVKEMAATKAGSTENIIEQKQ